MSLLRTESADLEGATVIDLRPLHAYNGWASVQALGEARRGHIPGAIALPQSWLTHLDDKNLAELLLSKGVGLDHDVVLYDHAGDAPPQALGRLSELGYGSTSYWDRGFKGWAKDESLPVEHLTRYDKLIHPLWLSELLAGREVEGKPKGRSLLFHVNFGVPEEYTEGHLPGAFYLDTNLLENPEDWNRRSPQELEVALCSLGIEHDTTVILYGRDTAGHADEKWPGRRAGQIAATRAALILHYCGVEDIRILDGGYDAWVGGGYPLEQTLREPTPVPSFGKEIPLHPEVLLDIEDAKQILATPGSAALVSVRTWAEHTGRDSGYNYIRPAGRIAGDVWGNCGTDAYHMQHYRNADNTMRPYSEIAANWDAAGITPDKHVAFYCGTGWRAAETWFYAYLMGWPRVAVYDGGWHEWSQDPDSNPISMGE